MGRWWSHENVVKFVVLDRHQMIKISENLLLVIKIITKIQRHERETEALSKVILLLNVSEKVASKTKTIWSFGRFNEKWFIFVQCVKMRKMISEKNFTKQIKLKQIEDFHERKKKMKSPSILRWKITQKARRKQLLLIERKSSRLVYFLWAVLCGGVCFISRPSAFNSSVAPSTTNQANFILSFAMFS